jgi:Arc/MetJ-type ribon-helix-helix transcriptional regulator
MASFLLVVIRSYPADTATMPLGPDYTTMTVSLPKAMREYVATRAKTGGFGSISDFIRDLIRRDQRESALPVAASSPPDSAASVPQDSWRELQASLMRGEVQMSAGRLQETAALMQTGILFARERIRREFPAASEAELDRHLAQWLNERAQGEREDAPWRAVSAERRQRILGEP